MTPRLGRVGEPFDFQGLSRPKPHPTPMEVIMRERDLAVKTLNTVARRLHLTCHPSPAIEQCWADVCRMAVSVMNTLKGTTNADT